MLRLLPLFFGLLLGVSTSAQIPLDYSKGNWGRQFRMDGRIVVHPDMKDLLPKGTAARKQYNGYFTNQVASSIFSGIGAGLIAISITDQLDPESEEIGWTPALIGLGAIGLSLPFHFAARKKARLTADAYNRELGAVPVVAPPAVSGRLGGVGTGWGLRFDFGR